MSTRDKIMDLGKNYMQAIGYHSFNYKMIANQLNIRNASIHHYFPSKEDLALAIIEKAVQDFNTWANSVKSVSPTEQAEVILNRYIQTFNEGEKMCLMSTFESAFNDVSENIKKATSTYVNSVFSWLIDIFKEGLQSNEFHFKESAEEMAVMWLAGLPGSLLVGRAKGAEYFYQIINRLRKSLKGE